MPSLLRMSRKQYLRLILWALPAESDCHTSDKRKTRIAQAARNAEQRKHLLEMLPKLEKQMDDVGTLGHVCYENLAMDSSDHGRRQYLPAGPKWETLKTVQQVILEPGMGTPIGQTPSQFCYPRYFWAKPRTSEDVEWERLQDKWDLANSGDQYHACGIRKHAYEGVASDWVAKHLQEWAKTALNHGHVPLPGMMTYTRCAKCRHFIEPNTSDEPGLAKFLHLDDGEQEYDHNAEPGLEATYNYWRETEPNLFHKYEDGKIGPNSPSCPQYAYGKVITT